MEILGAQDIPQCGLGQKPEIHISELSARRLPCPNLAVNQITNDRYWQNNNVLLLATCLKLYTFFERLHL